MISELRNPIQPFNPSFDAASIDGDEEMLGMDPALLVAEALEALAHPPAGQKPNTPNSEMIKAAYSAISSLGDPTAVLQALQAHLRDTNSEIRELNIQTNQSAAELAETLRQEAIRKAQQAGGWASKLFGKSKIFGWIAKTAAVVAAVALTVTTGGAGAALAIAGCALMLSGRYIADGLAKAGIIGEKDAAWLGFGLELAGSLMAGGAGAFSGAGAAATSAANAASTGAQVAQQGVEVAQLANTIATATQTSATIVQSGLQSAGYVCAHEANERTADSEESQLRRDDAQNRVETGIDDYKTIMKNYKRVARILAASREAQKDGRQAAVRLLA